MFLLNSDGTIWMSQEQRGDQARRCVPSLLLFNFWWARVNCSLNFLFLAHGSGIRCGHLLLVAYLLQGLMYWDALLHTLVVTTHAFLTAQSSLTIHLWPLAFSPSTATFSEIRLTPTSTPRSKSLESPFFLILMCGVNVLKILTLHFGQFKSKIHYGCEIQYGNTINSSLYTRRHTHIL